MRRRREGAKAVSLGANLSADHSSIVRRLLSRLVWQNSLPDHMCVVVKMHTALMIEHIFKEVTDESNVREFCFSAWMRRRASCSGDNDDDRSGHCGHDDDHDDHELRLSTGRES